MTDQRQGFQLAGQIREIPGLLFNPTPRSSRRGTVQVPVKNCQRSNDVTARGAMQCADRSPKVCPKVSGYLEDPLMLALVWIERRRPAPQARRPGLPAKRPNDKVPKLKSIEATGDWAWPETSASVLGASRSHT